jgi:hypothetical protein
MWKFLCCFYSFLLRYFAKIFFAVGANHAISTVQAAARSFGIFSGHQRKLYEKKTVHQLINRTEWQRTWLL